jgi:hypothetical protein
MLLYKRRGKERKERGGRGEKKKRGNLFKQIVYDLMS